MAKQTKLLTEFYRDYLAWFDAGCPEGPYSKTDGLCNGLWLFASRDGVSEDRRHHLSAELRKQFKRAGLYPHFPFETAHEFFTTDDLTTNPKRLAWVREHAGKGE